MSKSVNLVKSDISNLFEELETVATETKLEEKKKVKHLRKRKVCKL